MSVHPPHIECLPESPAPAKSWPGAKMLTGGKAYFSAPLGQLHYRDMGPRDARHTMLLLHQSPASMIEFGTMQTVLAARGIRSIIADTPGYGMSDQPDCLPSIGGFADNLVPLLDHLGLAQVVVGGHHTGASIAAALAARYPGRVAGLVLHGCPLYSAEYAEICRARPEWSRTPVRDGSHLSQIFSKKIEMRNEGDWMTYTWMSALMFLQGQDIGHWAVNRHDLAADLLRVRAPTLIITDEDDVTHKMDQATHALRPDFLYRVLSTQGMGTSAVMTAPERWADVAQVLLDAIPAA